MTLAGSPPAPGIGLYFHFPFCKARCPYCAFYFVVGREERRADYVEALVADLEASAKEPRFAGRRLETIYFGGGTPSLLLVAQIEQLLAAAHQNFAVSTSAEVSLEANPDGLTLGQLQGLRAAGVNRLTLGFQSLDESRQRILGRTNAREDNLRAFELARMAGFENLAIDLLFGVPGQTLDDWRRTLEEVGGLGPDHVSAYELTVEEGTRFEALAARGKLGAPEEETRARMFEMSDDILAAAGIHRYEVSNFARPGHECRHNSEGWRSGDLCGVGASAASHVRNERWSKVAELEEYVRRVRCGEDLRAAVEVLDDQTWAAEDLYLGLRLLEGINFETRIGHVSEPGRSRLGGVIRRAVAAGHLLCEGNRVRLSRRGLLFADSIFEELLTLPR